MDGDLREDDAEGTGRRGGPTDPSPVRASQGAIPWGRHLLFWAIALGGAAFDLTTKHIVFDWLGPPRFSTPRTVVPGYLELQTSFNPGALWGLGNTLPHGSLIFAALSVAAGVAIVVYLFGKGAAVDRRLTVALGLIMAGALGNCYDRVVIGKVRDFVHLHIDAINFDCAIFNFADNMLVAGALFLMLLALRPEPRAIATPPEESLATSSDGLSS